MAFIPYSKGENQGFTPLPEGTYQMAIREAEHGTSTGGNPQLKLRLEVMEGPKAGRFINCWYSLLPQASWKIDNLLEALGIDEVDTGDMDAEGNPIMGLDTDHLLDRIVQYVVTQQEYPAGSGKMNNRFNDEAPSPLEGAQKAAPAQEAAPAAQQATPPAQTMQRRRPRPAQS
jgi:hypothetical protein